MSRLPRVALVVGIVMMLMGFGFAFALYGQPRAMLPALDHDQAAVRNLVTMLGTRSLTMALALLVALLLRSPQALMAVLSMRALTEALDLVVIARDGASAGMAITVAMLLAELAALALLWRRLGREPDRAPSVTLPNPS